MRSELNFDWFGYTSFAKLYRRQIYLFGWIQTGQTGGQLYSLFPLKAFSDETQLAADSRMELGSVSPRSKLLCIWNHGDSSLRTIIKTVWLSGRYNPSELSLLIPEVHGSNPVIGKTLYWMFTVNCIEKAKLEKKRPFFKKIINSDQSRKDFQPKNAFSNFGKKFLIFCLSGFPSLLHQRFRSTIFFLKSSVV